jgi:hypothetical protein
MGLYLGVAGLNCYNLIYLIEFSNNFKINRLIFMFFVPISIKYDDRAFVKEQS